MAWILQGKTPAGGSCYYEGRKVKIEYRDYYLIYYVPDNMPLLACYGEIVFDSRVNTATAIT